MVEDSGAYCLFGSVLSDYVCVDASLQVSWIELRDTKAWPCEHGASSCVECGIIAAGEARVEIGRSPSDSGCCRSCKCTRSGASD